MLNSNFLKPEIAVVLHAYQPPTQKQEVLARIIENCYLPFANMLEENPEFKVTLNLNASLTEMLEKENTNVIERYASLARNNQVEFLESGAFHPILPLLSERESRYQITLNHRINLRIFGSIWRPVGFWPPELAVSMDLLKQLEHLGYQYTIVPEISLRQTNIHPTPLLERIPTLSSLPGLALVYRNRDISNSLSFKKYSKVDNFFEHVDHVRGKRHQKSFLILATDLETFGEHHKGYVDFLRQIFDKSTSCTIKDVLSLPRDEISEFDASSWSTSEENLNRNIPYPLWAFPGNSIHEIQNLHTEILSETLKYLLNTKKDQTAEIQQVMKEVAKAQYSCQTWWASVKDHFSKELILLGFQEQKRALKIILNAIDSDFSHTIITATSERLEERLNHYLTRTN